MEIGELLKGAVERGASDLHLTAGASPTVRIDGRLRPLTAILLKSEDTRNISEQLLNQQQLALLKEKRELGFSHSYPGWGRFRVNAFYQRGSIGLAIRAINMEIHAMSALGLPDIVAKLTLRPEGLILVTGPAGSGKSTTLAAMIDLINEERRSHIITLEDPIEYLHSHKNSIVNQREIGSDSRSFPGALQAALRQDPDVVMVGEMRDPGIIPMAMAAAEAGNLVLASMPTQSVHQTLHRIINSFSPERQAQIRMQLADTLTGIVSQRLLPRKDGTGRVAAVEFLVITPVIRDLILDGKIKQISNLMQTGARSGMRTMEDHLQQLHEKGIIER
jgi:twitching motility protein PilT